MDLEKFDIHLYKFEQLHCVTQFLFQSSKSYFLIGYLQKPGKTHIISPKLCFCEYESDFSKFSFLAKIVLSSVCNLVLFLDCLRQRGLHLVFIVYACLSNKSGQNFILFTKLTTYTAYSIAIVHLDIIANCK